MRRLVVAVVLAVAIAASMAANGPDVGPQADDAASASSRFDAARAMRYLRLQVERGPRPAGSRASRRLARWIAERYERFGLKRIEIQRPHRNVVGQIPGRGRGAVIVGAHHDTWAGDPQFVGANDGASGIAALLELARALPRRMPGPTLVIVAFDAEEARPGRSFAKDGTRGSRQFLRTAKAGGGKAVPRLKAIEAMILFDMVGDCDLALPREAGSDRRLYRRIARHGSASVFGGSTAEVHDDHTPFAEAGVPAVDLIDFRYGPGEAPGEWWHSSDDTLDKVCRASLAAAARPVERALRSWRG